MNEISWLFFLQVGNDAKWDMCVCLMNNSYTLQALPTRSLHQLPVVLQ